MGTKGSKSTSNTSKQFEHAPMDLLVGEIDESLELMEFKEGEFLAKAKRYREEALKTARPQTQTAIKHGAHLLKQASLYDTAVTSIRKQRLNLEERKIALDVHAMNGMSLATARKIIEGSQVQLQELNLDTDNIDDVLDGMAELSDNQREVSDAVAYATGSDVSPEDFEEELMAMLSTETKTDGHISGPSPNEPLHRPPSYSNEHAELPIGVPMHDPTPPRSHNSSPNTTNPILQAFA